MANLRRALLGISRILNSTALNGGSVVPITRMPSQTLQRPLVGSFSHFYSPNQSPDIDLSSEESKRRLFNRLIYRSRQRGFLELDLVLGKWVEEHIHSMDENGIKSLIDVLDLVNKPDIKFKYDQDVKVLFCSGIENPDLWKWLTGQEQPPGTIVTNPVFSALRDKVMNNLDSHAAPETRATPGQPWVRGWDDFKKGKDSPVSGNQ